MPRVWPMRLLYDGACPFCKREVAWLRRNNAELKLMFEDIAAVGFDPSRYGLTKSEVDKELHGVMANGEVVRGAEAVRRSYEAVGMPWVASLTRLPGAQAVTDGAYRLFAKNRIWLGRLIGRTCESCEVGIRD